MAGTKKTNPPRSGRISGDCENGNGKMEVRKNHVYEGQFKDGQPHGKGCLSARTKDRSGMVTTLTIVGTFEGGNMVTGTVTIGADTKEVTSYAEEIVALQEETAALEKDVTALEERGAAYRAKDGATWTGTWVDGKASGVGVWRYLDGREARGVGPEGSMRLRAGDDPARDDDGDEDTVTQWSISHITGTVTASTGAEQIGCYKKITALQQEITENKKAITETEKLAATCRANDGASWTGAWESGKASGAGEWRLRDGREAHGKGPEGKFPTYWLQGFYTGCLGAMDAVPQWVHDYATVPAVPAPELPGGDEGEGPGAEPAATVVTVCAPAQPGAAATPGAGGRDSDSSSDDDDEEDTAPPPPPPPVDPSKLRVVDLNAALQKRGVETKGLKLKKDLVPALESGGDHACD